jgi:succinate dehydrogenase / fumarate reductase flavoprotein subunit
MYERITGENAYRQPMRIFPAVHYTMGGLWVDYNLMSNLPGLFVLGEANFSDHGANRLGASALMQGLADGYFVIPYTIAHYFASENKHCPSTDDPAFDEAEENVRGIIDALLKSKGKRTVRSFHREVGKLVWENCGMARSKQSLTEAINRIAEIRAEYWENVNVPGSADDLNQALEYGGRVADYMEFAELLCTDALKREESCGGHFRTEHQFTKDDPEVKSGYTSEGEAKRRDDKFAYVAAWEYTGPNKKWKLHKEPLTYEEVKMSTRSYK